MTEISSCENNETLKSRETDLRRDRLSHLL